VLNIVPSRPLRYCGGGGYPKVLGCFLGVNKRPQEGVRGQLNICFAIKDDANHIKKKNCSKSNDTVRDKIR